VELSNFIQFPFIRKESETVYEGKKYVIIHYS